MMCIIRSMTTQSVSTVTVKLQTSKIDYREMDAHQRKTEVCLERRKIKVADGWQREYFFVFVGENWRPRPFFCHPKRCHQQVSGCQRVACKLLVLGDLKKKKPQKTWYDRMWIFTPKVIVVRKAFRMEVDHGHTHTHKNKRLIRYI